MTPKEKIREDFKRALLQTTRALSAQPDVEVAFGGDHAQVAGKTARIPLPARQLDPSTAAVARGESDLAALQLAHHDAATHARLSPRGVEAQAVFRALENARVEAIGANALKGVGDNLEAALDKTIADKGYQSLNAKDVAPLADVVALMLRERLTGRAAPPSAREIMTACEDDIERLAGASLDAIVEGGELDDLVAFSALARTVIRAL
ncbi:MAG: cobaltochelatase subunit CobT, partial [Pseudomonadota bacterium]